MLVSRIFGLVANRRRRRGVSLEIDALSEHRLSDLGVTRLDLLDPPRRR